MKGIDRVGVVVFALLMVVCVLSAADHATSLINHDATTIWRKVMDCIEILGLSLSAVILGAFAVIIPLEAKENPRR